MYNKHLEILHSQTSALLYSIKVHNDNGTTYFEHFAPFTDKNGTRLSSDEIVVNDDGIEMILRFGPYTAYDDDGIYDGWGWFLQAGACNEEGKLIIYQVLPVSFNTPEFISRKCKFIDNHNEPTWYREFVRLCDAQLLKEINDGTKEV